MKFFKMLKKESREFKEFSNNVDKNISNSRNAQQRMHEENARFSKQVQQNLLNHSK